MIRRSSYKYYPQQLAFGQVHDISYFKVFGSTLYVSIAPLQRSIMGSHKTATYVALSIVKYIEPLTSDSFTTQHANYHFGESVFSPLRADYILHNLNSELSWI